MLVNKANRPQMLIKDGMRTLITNDLFKVSGYLWTPTNLFLSLPHPKKTTWNQMVSMRNKTTMNMTRKNCSAMLVAGIIEMLTCHANASWTCFFENPFLKELPLFFLTEDLIGASFFGVSRRHWPIPIGWATADTHSSALKTAYGDADKVIYL